MHKNIQAYVSQLVNNSSYQNNDVYYRIVSGKYPQDYKVISISKLEEYDYRESCFHDDIKYSSAEEALKVMNDYVNDPSNFKEDIFESDATDMSEKYMTDEDKEEFLNFIFSESGLDQFLNDQDHILYVFTEFEEDDDTSSMNEEIINQHFHEIPSLQLKFYNGKLHQQWIILYNNEILKKEWRIVPSEWEENEEK